MRETTNINLRLDKELKLQSEELFEKLGINMTTALNIFLRQAVREQSIPFKITAKEDHGFPIPPDILAEIKSYPTYNDYVSAKLEEADIMAAENPIRYTMDEVRAHVEELLNGKK